VALVFVVTALFHVVAILSPTLAPGAPPWRHALFVALNASVAIGLVWRPPGFVVGFALLTLQQLYSHGLDMWEAWHADGRVDWMSLAVVVVMPAVLFALLTRRV